jgi:hypothetical protein
MSDRDLEGFSARDALTIPINTALSEAFAFGGWEYGQVIVPAEWTAANIGFCVCDTVAGTYVILRDDTGTPVQVSGIKADGSRAYALPAKLAGARFVKLWSKHATAGTETDVNQTAERALVVMKA